MNLVMVNEWELYAEATHDAYEFILDYPCINSDWFYAELVLLLYA